MHVFLDSVLTVESRGVTICKHEDEAMFFHGVTFPFFRLTKICQMDENGCKLLPLHLTNCKLRCREREGMGDSAILPVCRLLSFRAICCVLSARSSVSHRHHSMQSGTQVSLDEAVPCAHRRANAAFLISARMSGDSSHSDMI